MPRPHTVRAGFEPIHELLTGEPIETLCQLAERERERALRELQAAEASGDTRRIHKARLRAQALTLKCTRGGE